MSYHAGIGGTVTINGTELALTRWSVNPSATIVAFMNSKTGKFAKKQSTFEDCDFSFSIDYDDAANAFAAPLTLAPGQTITQVKLFLDNTAVGLPPNGEYWHFPSAIIQRTPQTLEVVGRIETTIDCTSDGTYGTPGNPVP